MSDIEEITQLLVRYATGIDTRDWDLFRTCFTDDCRIDYRPLASWQGVDALTAFMRASHTGPSLHRLSNMAIDVDGDTARAWTYVDAVVGLPGNRGAITNIGTYDDRLVRTADGWRIHERTYTQVRTRLPGPLSLVPSNVAGRIAALGARIVKVD